MSERINSREVRGGARRTRPAPGGRGARRGAGGAVLPGTPAHSALREVLRVGGLIRRLSEPHLARYGVSSAQWGVLRALERLEAAGHSRPKMHELGEALLVRPPSLSATLERMEHAGLVSREADEADHRTRRVSVTALGRGVLARAVPEHARWIDRMMGALSAGQQSRLAELLGRLARHLQAESEPAGQEQAAPGEPRKSKRRDR